MSQESPTARPQDAISTADDLGSSFAAALTAEILARIDAIASGEGEGSANLPEAEGELEALVLAEVGACIALVGADADTFERRIVSLREAIDDARAAG